MKKISLFALLLITPLFIAGCGGDDEAANNSSGSAENADKLMYETDNFSLLFPKDWEILESNSFTSNVPQETVVGLRNNLKSNIFTANINIAQTALEQEQTLDSRDFAKSSLAEVKKSLVNFNQISLEDYNLTYGDEEIATYISDLEGRKTASEPTIHFKQLHIVNDGIGYTVTGAYTPNEDESVVTQIEETLKSFQLK